LSYLVSYVFLAIIWINHHRLLLFAHEATPKLIWWNFAHLFMTSLVLSQPPGLQIQDSRQALCFSMQQYS
jgi:uncharacterized membrane protein